jgi:hypothetical protein
MLHQVVVHHIREVIGREAVRLEHHEVVGELVLEHGAPVDQVVVLRRAFQRHFEADDIGQPRFLARFDFGGGELAAAAIVHRGGGALGALLRSHLLQLFGRAEALVRLALLHQLARDALVNLQPLRLVVGRVRTADFGSLVPVQPQPAQRVQNRLLGTLHEARAVGVLDAHDEFAPVVAGKDPVEQRGANVAHMGHPCRAGRVAYPNHQAKPPASLYCMAQFYPTTSGFRAGARRPTG